MTTRFWAFFFWLTWLCGPTLVRADSPESYLKLRDHLDRPRDGYCIDVPGTPGRERFDRPLFAHNCKPGRGAPDGIVVHRADGTILMPAYGTCLTAMGVLRTLLPGSALMLKDCGDRTPFIDGAAFQRFAFEADGRLRVVGFDACLAVSAESDRTYSPADTWRALFVADCDTVDPALSTWTLVSPY